MNKSLLFSSLFGDRIIIVLAICILLSLPAIQLAGADAAPGPDPTVGGAGPYQPQKTNVQMLSETVLIDVPPYRDETSNQISVSASFTMQNQGQAEEKMQVIFPLTQLNYDFDEGTNYEVDPASFVVWVDGTQEPTTEITTPAEKGYQLEYSNGGAASSSGFYPDVRWAAFDVIFPVHQKVSLLVQYKMDVYGSFTGIGYILETGAGWYGKILSADLVLRLPYTASSETVVEANPGYVFSGNEVRWKLTNFEPTRADDLEVRIIPPQDWQVVLELRSRIEQYPNDADAWLKLGDQYDKLGFWDSPAGIEIRDQHLVDLCIQALEKAIALNPDQGVAHYHLAHVLWFADLDLPRGPGRSMLNAPALGDPTVQRVIREMKLAGSQGVTSDSIGEFTGDYFFYSDFLAYINSIFPDLNLPTPVADSASPIPTPTLTAIKTATPTLSTATPTSSPTAAPTSTYRPSVYVGIAVGLLIVVGALVFLLWRSKSNPRP